MWLQAHATEDQTHLSWDEYKKSVYGFTDDANDHEDEDGDSFKKMIERDDRRWKAADTVSRQWISGDGEPPELVSLR